MKSYLSIIPAEGLPVEKVKGQYCCRKIGGKLSRKVYIAQGYCRFSKKYILADTEDISRAIYLKKGTLVFEPELEEDTLEFKR